MEQLILPEEGLLHIFGINNENLRYLEKSKKVRIISRGDQVLLDGPDENVAIVKRLLEGLARLVKSGYILSNGDIKTALKAIEKENNLDLIDFFINCRLQTSEGRFITPKSINQRLFIRAMQQNDVVIAVGPAGTGKTYLAAAAAVTALRKNQVKRIILARPAIEAGERLGFLPGDLTAKVDPYLRPLYDALYDLMNMEKVANLIEKGVIEIAPLAFMRGRDLKNSFIILDEAQNTTIPQMKMFLTRMGNGSKAVINGDITQVDLPEEKKSGLSHCVSVLKKVEGISIIYFDRYDVVRHPLVEQIIQAYEKDRRAKKSRQES